MKIKIKTIRCKTIIIIIIIFGLIIAEIVTPKISRAEGNTGTLIGNLLWNSFGKDILFTILEAVQYFLSWLVKAGASFLEAMLNVSFLRHLNVIKEGWTLLRNFANMLFILFMVIIAFATILRIEQYGIKKLLPKVIFVALLINFSMVFCAAIIDVSNVTADFFIKDIKNKISGEQSISASFADAMNIGGIYKVYTDCDQFFKEEWSKCIWKFKYIIDFSQVSRLQCETNVLVMRDFCQKQGKIATRNDDATFLNLFLATTVGSIVMLIAAFTLFAGGILLLIRVISLWMLVMISPLVYTCYVLPSLNSNWKKWWSKFLNWCIFAPVYTFFIWVAVKLAVNNFNKEMEIAANSGTSGVIGDFGTGAHSFLTNPAGQLVSYGVMVGFLIGGLVVAKQLGVAGADSVMKIATNVKKGATDWAKRTALKPSKYAGAGALRMGAKLFGGENTKLGRRMGAKAAQVKQSTAQSKENKAYANLLKTMNDKDLLREVETAGGVRKLIATQEAKRRGLLREAERPVVQKSMQAMRSYGDEEGARSLEELRPDAIENDPARKEAIERAIKEGTHKKWSKKVLQSPEGIRVLGELKRQLGIGEFAKVFKGWAKEIQETAEDAMKSEFTSDFTNMDNISKRKDYAKVTGKVQEAFLSDNMGVIQSSYFASSKRSIQNYIQGLGNEDFGNLRTNSDKALAARYIKPSQVQGAGAKLTGKDKERMKIIAQGFNPAAYDEMIKPKSNWTT